MVSMTMGVSAELKKRMNRHPEVRWTDVARAAIQRQLDDLESMEKAASKSRLSEKDLRQIAQKVDREMLNHFEALFRAARG